MIVDKTFETLHAETETGLTCYVNCNNEIYISCGRKNDYSETGQPSFEGFTVLDIEDAKALIIELMCLVESLENNIF